MPLPRFRLPKFLSKRSPELAGPPPAGDAQAVGGLTRRTAKRLDNTAAGSGQVAAVATAGEEAALGGGNEGFPEFIIAKPQEYDRGLAVWLAVALLAGFLLNFMPCVLPVVRIQS